MASRRPGRAFFARPATEVAPELLGLVLVHGPVRARLVEVEAYMGGGVDPGSHSHRGQTRRNATMFGSPGHLYVYFTYGMHWCANVVTGRAGDGEAVLLRAAEPLVGLEVMRVRRTRPAPAPGPVERDLCRGPGRLAQAFGFDGGTDGADLVRADAVGPRLVDDGGTPPDLRLATTTRIGLRAGEGDDHLWRFAVAGSRYLSRPAR